MLTQNVAGRTWDYSHSVGGRYIALPVALAVASEDRVYAVSRQYEQVGNVPWNRVATGAKVGIITTGGVSGDEEFVGDFSKYGDAPGELIWPTGIVLDGQENVYVTDEWMHRVAVFDREGNFQTQWGAEGSGDGQFHGPAGIARDGDGNLYIADSLNHRVQVVRNDGRYLRKWGTHGSGEGELDSPWGITVDHQGYVYVADHKNHRVQKFTPEGEFLAAFGRYGTGRGELSHPSDVAVDPDGDVYVCDWANDRVQVYSPDTGFITSFIGDAQQMAKWHQMTVDANADVIKARRRAYSLEPEWRFALPTAVEFDTARDRLLVADTQRGRLQIYNKLRGYLEPQFNL